MPVVIREITSEVVLTPEEGAEAPPGGADRPPAGEDELVERVVRRAVERVTEILRLEWER
jgi:hypothetical protein